MKKLLLLWLLLVPTAAPIAQTTINGFASSGISAGSGGLVSASNMRLMAITPTVNATITAVYIGATATASSITARAVIYDSTPSALLAESNTFSSLAIGGNRFALTSNLSVTAGTTYFVGIITNNNLTLNVQAFASNITEYTITSGMNASTPPNPITTGGTSTTGFLFAVEYYNASPATCGFGPDKTVATTISGTGNTTATLDTSGRQGARSIVTYTGGIAAKVYAEFVVSGPTHATTFVGVSSAGINMSFLAPQNHSAWFTPSGSTAGSVPTVTTVSFTGGDNIGIAYDVGANHIWMRKNGGTWHGNGAGADPATDTSPLVFGAPLPTNWPMMLAVGDYLNGTTDATVFNLKSAAAWQTYSAPSGFSAWDTTCPPPPGATAAKFFFEGVP